MDYSAFELSKHNAYSNIVQHIHNTPIIGYGRIINVIDITTVVVESVVQTGAVKDTYTVKLLALSSVLMEASIYPQINDTVLLLFLQKYDPRMFTQETVQNYNAAGYDSFSGVGILMSTAKRYAATLIHMLESGTNINSIVPTDVNLSSRFSLVFCRAVADSNDEELISVLFGEGRPLIEQYLSKVTREYGFLEGNINATVIERYSVNAPIMKDIQGTQTVTIGIDDDNADTDAGVKVTIGKKADITVTSGSGKTETYDKTIKLESKEAITVKATQKVEIEASQISIGSSTEKLGTILSEFINLVKNLATAGSAAAQTVNPASQALLEALKLRCEALLVK